MTCQWSSIRSASLPISSSESWSTAVRTVSLRPSQLASPQPTIPLLGLDPDEQPARRDEERFNPVDECHVPA